MSQPTVYLGPFVEWLLTPEEARARFPLRPFYGNEPAWLDLELDGKLVAAWTGPELPPALPVRGGRYHRLPFTPCEFPPVRALRELQRSHAGVLGVADLRDADPRGVRAEIAWLARTYAPEIARLNEYVGGPGTLRWGIVAYEPG